jgi:hypothetical protein
VLVVDGQHRISALFQALVAPNGVELETDERRSYAFDIAASLARNIDRAAAIVSESSGETAQFALRHVFSDADGEDQSAGKDRATPSSPSGGSSAIDEFERHVLSNFREYRLPVIRLDPATTSWTIRVRGGADGLELERKYGTKRPWEL